MVDIDKIISDILWDDEDYPESPDRYKAQIELFEKDLAGQKLSEKTAKKHVENVDFYLHDFGVIYEQIHELKSGCQHQEIL